MKLARPKHAPRPVAPAPVPGLRVLAPPVYFAGLLFVGIPVADLILNLWPFTPGELGWRYGAIGLFANFLHTPLLGALIITLFAAAVGHRRVIRAGGFLWLAVSVVLVLAIITFTLDALQLRPTVLPESLLVYHTSVARAILKHFTGAVAFGLLGWASLKGTRSETSRRGRRAEPQPVAETQS